MQVFSFLNSRRKEENQHRHSAEESNSTRAPAGNQTHNILAAALQSRIPTSLSDSDCHTCDDNDKLSTPCDFRVLHRHSATRPTELVLDDAAALRLCDLKKKKNKKRCAFRNKLNILFSGRMRRGWHFGAVVASQQVGHKFNLLGGVSMFSLCLSSSFLQLSKKNEHVTQTENFVVLYYSADTSRE